MGVHVCRRMRAAPRDLETLGIQVPPTAAVCEGSRGGEPAKCNSLSSKNYHSQAWVAISILKQHDSGSIHCVVLADPFRLDEMALPLQYCCSAVPRREQHAWFTKRMSKQHLHHQPHTHTPAVSSMSAAALAAAMRGMGSSSWEMATREDRQ
jgi:hypothetical protein